MSIYARIGSYSLSIPVSRWPGFRFHIPLDIMSISRSLPCTFIDLPHIVQVSPHSPIPISMHFPNHCSSVYILRPMKPIRVSSFPIPGCTVTFRCFRCVEIKGVESRR